MRKLNAGILKVWDINLCWKLIDIHKFCKEFYHQFDRIKCSILQTTGILSLNRKEFEVKVLYIKIIKEGLLKNDS